MSPTYIMLVACGSKDNTFFYVALFLSKEQRWDHWQWQRPGGDDDGGGNDGDTAEDWIMDNDDGDTDGDIAESRWKKKEGAWVAQSCCFRYALLFLVMMVMTMMVMFMMVLFHIGNLLLVALRVIFY